MLLCHFRNRFHNFENVLIAVCKLPKSTLVLHLHADGILLGVNYMGLFTDVVAGEINADVIQVER